MLHIICCIEGVPAWFVLNILPRPAYSWFLSVIAFMSTNLRIVTFFSKNYENSIKVILKIQIWWFSPVFLADLASIKSYEINFWVWLYKNYIVGYKLKNQNGTSRPSIDSLTSPRNHPIFNPCVKFERNSLRNKKLQQNLKFDTKQLAWN